MRAAVFHPAARAAIRKFPREVRKELGKAIFDLQKGEALSMPLSRHMPIVAVGVEELRFRDRAGIYRVFYYARSPRGVLVFHAFVKKSRTAPRHEMLMARKRLEEMQHEEI